jgi:hypothetical protein
MGYSSVPVVVEAMSEADILEAVRLGTVVATGMMTDEMDRTAGIVDMVVVAAVVVD